MATEWTLTIDCADPMRLAAFWKQALGYRERPAPDGFRSWSEWFSNIGVPEAEWNDGAYIEDPNGVLPRMSFLRVPEGKIVKNRMHIDVQAGGERAEPLAERWPRVRTAVAELVDAGAVLVRQYDDTDGRPDHVVMTDPEGNEFCVV